MARGDIGAARRELARLRSGGAAEVEVEMEAMLQAAARSRAASASHADDAAGAAPATSSPSSAAAAAAAAGPLGVARLLLSPGVRAPFGLGCALMFFQQFSGINAVS